MAHHTLLVDADYVERVAFDLIVNFERMLGRRIPPAPLADWLDYVALDGGLLPAEGEAQTADNEIRVYFIHRPETAQLQTSRPRTSPTKSTARLLPTGWANSRSRHLPSNPWWTTTI